MDMQERKLAQQGNDNMALQSTLSDTMISLKSASSDHRDNEHDLSQDAPSHLVPSTLVCGMSVSALVECCMNEFNKYRRGESSDDQYGVELFRRALVQHDPLAWEAVQHCFNETMLHWIRAHPYRMSACRFDSEENYVVQAWTRLWMASIGQRGLAFGTLTAVLRYLRASLNGAILDTLQAYARPKEIPLSAPGDPEELFAEDLDEGREIWESIRSLLPDEREQRLAYLLFHCGLKPREIVRLRPQEFHNVQDIYRLRCNITEQLLRNVDRLRWQLRAFPKII